MRKITYMHAHLQVVRHLSVHVCALCILVRTRVRVCMRTCGSEWSKRVCPTRLVRTRKSRLGVRIGVSLDVRACAPVRASSARMHAHLWRPSRLRLRVQRLPARVWTRLRSRARMRIYRFRVVCTYASAYCAYSFVHALTTRTHAHLRFRVVCVGSRARFWACAQMRIKQRARMRICSFRIVYTYMFACYVYPAAQVLTARTHAHLRPRAVQMRLRPICVCPSTRAPNHVYAYAFTCSESSVCARLRAVHTRSDTRTRTHAHLRLRVV